MQKIIIVLLFILTSSKKNIIEFNKEIPFDINNNEFEFTPMEYGSLFISITFNYSYVLELNITAEYSHILKTVTQPGLGTIVNLNAEDTYIIRLEYNDPTSIQKGTIWVNPSFNEIQVDLNKVYKWKYTSENTYLLHTKLTYSIDNAQKKVTFIFKYNNQTELYADIIEIPNPFEVCHGEECKGNITTYDFEPGESYKIYVNANKVQIERSDYYILPSFKFHDINKKDDEESDTDSDFDDSFSLRLNFWFISLILLIL
jgi:hypothetical protein